MIPGIPYLLAGFCVLSTPGAYAARLLELCRAQRFVYEDFRHTPDGGIALRFTSPTAKRVEALCREQEIPVCVCGEGGLTLLLRRLWRRPGLLVGLILGLWLLALSQGVVWDVRISGNETLSDRGIEEILSACGFGVGTSLQGFEADRIENDVLMQDGRLAWISINRKGTVAYVEVREKAARPDPAEDAPCDIVAARGGVVERVELEAGNTRVSAGQIVGEGEVLVSGLYDSTQQGIRFTAAKARVFARTTRILTVQIPLKYEQKVYLTDGIDSGLGVCQEKTLIFFGNHIKFSKKTGNYEGFCDTIEDERSWGLKEGVGFPVSVRTVWYVPYEIRTAIRTYGEAEELAYFELARQIALLPGGAELIGKTVSVHHGADALTLTCTLTCIEDIGAVRPIEIAK